MGRAVRDRGYALAIPAMGVGHTAAEDSLLDLFRHELRWTRTIRLVNPIGHLGSFVTHGFTFSVMAALLLNANLVSLAILAFALAARLFLKARIDGLFGTMRAPSGWCRCATVKLCGVPGFAVWRNGALARDALCGRAFGRHVPGLKT
jgi:ceramide glucosyltransferase